MNIIISSIVVGIIIGSLVPGFLSKKREEQFKSDLEKQYRIDLQEEVEKRTKIICENCYYKKRCVEFKCECDSPTRQ